VKHYAKEHGMAKWAKVVLNAFHTLEFWMEHN